MLHHAGHQLVVGVAFVGELAASGGGAISSRGPILSLVAVTAKKHKGSSTCLTSTHHSMRIHVLQITTHPLVASHVTLMEFYLRSNVWLQKISCNSMMHWDRPNLVIDAQKVISAHTCAKNFSTQNKSHPPIEIIQEQFL